MYAVHRIAIQILPCPPMVIPELNSDIKPPLLVVDPERFYRSGEKWAVD
jgi:hypothetical protein